MKIKEEFRKLLKAAVLCTSFCILIAIFVALLLRTPLFAEQKAYLYRLLFLAAICCIVLLAASVAVFRKREQVCGISFSTNILCIALSTIFMCLFFALGPMVIERSYTVYSLADMTDHEEVVYSAEDIKTQFVEGYIEGANESQKRIDEQVFIGNLKEVPGGYQITEKGKNYVKLFRLVEAIFPVPDENSIYPNGH